jgi:hypothetical protein
MEHATAGFVLTFEHQPALATQLIGVLPTPDQQSLGQM